jgi:hypothetical protein
MSLKTITERCHFCGRYFFRPYTTRPPIFCDECAAYRKKERNKIRQSNYRKRKRAAQRRPDAEPPQPATGDNARETERYTPAAQRGLFGTQPEPVRTKLRKGYGLP